MMDQCMHVVRPLYLYPQWYAALLKMIALQINEHMSVA